MERNNEPSHVPAPGAGDAGVSTEPFAEPAAPVSGGSFAESSIPTPAAPASETGVPATVEPERHFVHHSYIWLGSLRAIGAFLVAIVVGLASSVPGILLEIRSVGTGGLFGVLAVTGAVLGGIVLLGALVVVGHVWGYRHLYYEIGEEEFSLYSGIFNKKRMHVPYQRVQSVNHTATLLQRLAGVCTVKVETAGGAANEGATVPYVTNADAETLRLELFARKQAVLAGRPIPANVSAASVLAAARQGAVPGASVPAGASADMGGVATQPGVTAGTSMPASNGMLQADGARNVLDGADEILQDVRGVWGGMEVDTGQVTYEHGLSNRELVLTGLTSGTSFVLIVIGLVGTLSQVAGFAFELLGSRASDAANAAFAASASLPIGTVIAGIATFLAVVAVLWALSALGSCLTYGGFRARRRDSRIEVEHGLLSRKFHGVDVDRVQSVIIRQGLIRRLMGYCEVSLGKIDSVGQSGDDQEANALKTGLVVHPFVKMDRVPEILAGLVPEFADAPTETRPVARVALRRALIRRCTWAGSGLWVAAFTAVVQVSFMLAMQQLPNMQADVAPYLGVVNLVFAVLYALAVLCIVLDAVGAVLWFRESSFAFNRHFMTITNGGFSRESVLLPRRKIQFGTVKSNPFQRAARVRTVLVTTAAGVGTTLSLVDAGQADAEAWLDWVRPGGNR